MKDKTVKTRNIVGLPGWTTLGVEEVASELVIQAVPPLQPSKCIHCGFEGKMHVARRKSIKYRDIPYQGKPVILECRITYYRCRECGQPLSPQVPDISADGRLTQRCLTYIKEQSIRRIVAHVAQTVGVTPGMIHKHWNKRPIASADATPSVPRWMGLDVVRAGHKDRLVITDVQSMRPVDILDANDLQGLAAWLRNHNAADQVELVAIDPNVQHKAVVKQALPDATLVVGKLHVLKQLELAMKAYRHMLHKRRKGDAGDGWARQEVIMTLRGRDVDQASRLNTAYWMDTDAAFATALRHKDAFYDWYETATSENAAQGLDAWCRSMPDEMKTQGDKCKKGFLQFLDMVELWRVEILAYFTHRISNGYSEAYNGAVKLTRHHGKPSNLKVTRARILGAAQQPTAATWPNEVAALQPTGDAQSLAELNKRQDQLTAQGGYCTSCCGKYQIHEVVLHNEQALCILCHERELLIDASP